MGDLKKATPEEAIAATFVMATLALEWATQPETGPMFMDWARAKGCPIDDWNAEQFAAFRVIMDDVTTRACNEGVRRG